MKSILRKITHVGVKDTLPKLQARGVILSNSIALISAVVSTAYLLYSLRNGWTFYDSVLATAISVLLGVFLLNSIGFIKSGKVLLTIAIPAAALTLMFVNRVPHPENFQYAPGSGIYAALLATSAVPLLIFSNQERKLMIGILVINFILFGSIDTLLRYYSTLHTLPTLAQYISSNLAFLLSYLLMAGSVLSLKNIVDEFEVKNNELIETLNQKNIVLERTNHELHELNHNIETQNAEMQAQSEELLQSQESLIVANNEIERQKAALEKQNESLEELLDEKSKHLLHTNHELVSQNNELQQFSYTVSHNLRGPVASMLGLMNIHRITETPDDQKRILQLLEQSAKSLETIIQDLNKIIDIRNNKFAIFEEVYFEKELRLIQESLGSFIEENEVEINVNFQCDQVTSIKAYVNSILYNLISNAIQYRSYDRKPLIKISTIAHNGHIVLEVCDNGLGIDLSKFEGDLFKLYKRFHTHTQGKGLGLYLVKQQVEKLNGRIEVESKPDNGATFRVLIPAKKAEITS